MKTDFITMEARGTEFKMYTKYHEVRGTWCELFRVVNDVEHYIKEIASYEDGKTYIREQYDSGWNAFTLFADTLHDEIRENMHMFDFEGFTEIHTQTHMTVLGITCKLWLIVKCEYESISEVKVDHIDICNNPDMDELCSHFVAEFYKIVSNAFNCEISIS